MASFTQTFNCVLSQYLFFLGVGLYPTPSQFNHKLLEAGDFVLDVSLVLMYDRKSVVNSPLIDCGKGQQAFIEPQ